MNAQKIAQMQVNKQIRKRHNSKFLLMSGILALLFSFAPNAEEMSNQIQKISFFSLPGNDVQIALEFSGAAPQPLSFTTDNPARIVLDFPSVNLNLEQKSQSVGIGAVASINAAATEERSRVVVDLVYTAPFEIERDGQRLVMVIGRAAEPGRGEGVRPAPQVTTSLPPLPPATPMAVSVPSFTPSAIIPVAEEPRVEESRVYKEPSIESIDFRRSSSGAGQIITTLSDPTITIDMREESGNIVIEFQDTHLPASLDRRLDVTDFATPVLSVDTTQRGKKVEMMLKVTGQYQHQAYQVGNVYTIEVKQTVPEEKKEVSIAEKVYTGERLSLNFQNIDIHAVLNLIADFKNFNVVTTDAVRGTVTLRLKNVPWDQALDIILDSKGLGYRQMGNVLSIDLKINIDERRRKELELQEQIKKLEPLRTEFIQINYSKAAELSKLLQERMTGDTNVGHSFLSERGSVSIDVRTNTLIIQDTAERIADIRKLIAELDRPVRQVLIESRVVIASDEFTKDLGVQFGQSTNYRVGDDGWGMVTGGKREGDTTYPSGYSYNTGNKENYIVDLPPPAYDVGAAFGLAIGKVGTYLLHLELAALQREGRGEIIANPRVVTANQQKATIKQGVEVVVLGVAGVGASLAPTFKALVLQLEVTPQITPDDRIIMDLKVNKDNVGLTGGYEVREVTTQVLVDNGETVVLGGVYEQTLSNTVDRVPFFGDLPVVGHLFRRTSDIDQKRELLIFVTPKILKEKAAGSS